MTDSWQNVWSGFCARVKSPGFAVLSILALALAAPAGLAAQQNTSRAPSTPPQKSAATEPAPHVTPLAIPVGTQFMTHRGLFPISISPYLQRRVPAPLLENSPAIGQMIHNGKLELSLNDAIRLAIENNLGIDIQRYSTWITDTNVLLARGGTNEAGAPLDAQVASNLQWAQQTVQINNPFTAGTGVPTISSITDKSEGANFTYTQGFLSGTGFQVAFDNIRSSTNSPGTFINPSINTSLSFGITQPLLRGFGFLPNEYTIIEARNNSRIARYDLAAEAMSVVASVETQYWNLAADVESVKVAQYNVNWSQKNLQAQREELAIGTTDREGVTYAQTSVAQFQQQLARAQVVERQAETTLLNLIVRNEMAARLRNVLVIPTASINTPPKINLIPYGNAVAEAWRDRPDLLAQQLTLKNYGVAVKANRNLLLPQLNLTAQYQSSGLAGNSTLSAETPTGIAANTSAPVVDANGKPVLINGQPVYSSEQTFTTQVEQIHAGLLDSWNTLINQNYPSYVFGLNLTLPVHNRAAQATDAHDLLARRQQEESVQYLENQIAMQVRNAQVAVRGYLLDVRAAEQYAKLARQTLSDEQEKFRLGKSSQFLVTQDASNLAQAQSTEIQSKALLLEALVSLNEALGRTLQVHNISISDAATGHMLRTPLIPGTPVPFLTRNSFPLGAR